MCEEKINNKISSFATVVLTTIFLAVGYYMVKKHFLVHDQPKPIPDTNNTKHVVSWKRFGKLVLKYRIQNFCVKAARKILRSPDKSLQEQICALHRILLPGKDHSPWAEQDQRQLMLASASTTQQSEDEGEEDDDEEDEEEEWNDDNDDEEDEEVEVEEVGEEEIKSPNTRGRTQQATTLHRRK